MQCPECNSSSIDWYKAQEDDFGEYWCNECECVFDDEEEDEPKKKERK